MTKAKHSDGRLFLGAGLFLLSFIGAFASFYAVASALVFPSHFFVFRVFVGAMASLVLLAGACLAVSDASGFWQLPLQAFAVAAIVVGVATVVSAAFGNWHLLFGALGFRALASLLAGVGAGYVMRRLQIRFLPRHHA
ncbi:MAG: hypothetical protein KGN77_14305 [Xanthomonadaceae bacterium]|nr:hypothetical protein [Xanthomonadaceae bacterium]